ncbi:MAG TPA: OmpA family protein [Steroidobacteraceae bacterium]|nr:OmpA family protein [Steroidobacteraceae bacterium]
MDETHPVQHHEFQSVGLRLVANATDHLARPRTLSSAQRPATAARGMALTADILFATDSDELDSSAASNLDRLAAFLVKYRARTGLIEGYTDSSGMDFGNQDLSLRRAESVHSYLVAHGIDATRLVSVGRGSARPVASNESVVGRQQNRRVEVLISNDQGSTNQAANAPLHRASGTSLDLRG